MAVKPGPAANTASDAPMVSVEQRLTGRGRVRRPEAGDRPEVTAAPIETPELDALEERLSAQTSGWTESSVVRVYDMDEPGQEEYLDEVVLFELHGYNHVAPETPVSTVKYYRIEHTAARATRLAASVWAGIAFIMAYLGLGLAGYFLNGPYADEYEAAAAGARLSPVWLVPIFVLTWATFYIVRRYGPPRINGPRVLVGSVVAFFAVAASISGPVIWWGAVLVGGWVALTGLTRRPASP